jgi:hypothetical protein
VTKCNTKTEEKANAEGEEARKWEILSRDVGNSEQRNEKY